MSNQQSNSETSETSRIVLPNPEDLEIPIAVRTAAKTGQLAFFVGNGISRLYGLPSWEDLSGKMLSRLAARGILSHAQAELLKRQSLKTRISIADSYFKEHLDSKAHSDLVYADFLKPAEEKKHNPAYPMLARCNAKFITTNYDDLFSKALQGISLTGEVVQDSSAVNDQTAPSKLNRSNVENIRIFKDPYKILKADFLDNNVLYHIHGSIDDETKIIASTQDYVAFYTDPNTTEFLGSLFRSHCVIFIGYGLDELELLELVVKSRKSAQVSPMFLILPIFTYEASIINHLKRYYEGQLGITILPFAIDRDNYEGFGKVLERWSTVLAEISPRQASRVGDMNTLDELLKELADAR